MGGRNRNEKFKKKKTKQQINKTNSTLNSKSAKLEEERTELRLGKKKESNLAET
jgi:hypothetical protein